MSSIVNFFDNPFFIIMGGISTILITGGFLYTTFLIVKGVIPVWYRLGRSLSKGKIAIFSTTQYSSLRNMMIDAKLFQEKNIMEVGTHEINRAKKANLFLVHWNDYKNEIDQILNIKEDWTALVIYAPKNEGIIENQAILDKINSHRNSVIVNFRGRLLNDILISLITSSYERG